MDDKELLGLLAQDAPRPGPGLADEIVRSGRRVRTRRRLTIAGGAAAMAVVVAVGIPLTLRDDGHSDATVAAESAPRPMADPQLRGSGNDAKRAVPSEGASADTFASPPLAKNGAPEAASALDSAIDQRASVYAAAISYFLESEAHFTTAQRLAVVVLDQNCPYQKQCTAPGFDDRLKKQLKDALPGENLQFVPQEGAGPVLKIGAIAFSGNVADVPISVSSGPKTGRGLTYRLQAKEGRWLVVGTVGQSWTS